MNGFRKRLVEVALSQVGEREVGHNGGEVVREYQAATYLEPGDWPWCAAFVCWCLREAAGDEDLGFILPRTPRAFDFERFGKSSGELFYDPYLIKPGDIVIYDFSHVGIAVKNLASHRVYAVEGNTNPAGSREGDGVYTRSRDFSLIRSIVRL